MLKTLGIVDACFDSDRAREVAGRRLGGKSILEWVIRQSTDCQRLDGVIVVTDDTPSNMIVSELTPLDVPVFIGHGDRLDCHEAALEQYPSEAFVRIRVDSPFADPVLIDRLVRTAESREECDYAAYDLPERDDERLTLGAEWFRCDALRRAGRHAKSAESRSEPSRGIRRRAEKYEICLVDLPSNLTQDDVRFSVDIEEDWEHILALFEAFGPEEMDWQRIADLLERQPESAVYSDRN